MPRAPESIATAALLVNGEVWTLPRPARHHHLVMAWISVNAPGEAAKTIARIPDHEQGFVTSAGRFVSREHAAAIAYEAGQIGPGTAVRRMLFSEDVW